MLVATRLAAGFRDEVIISPDPRICMQRGSQCSAHIVFLMSIIIAHSLYHSREYFLFFKENAWTKRKKAVEHRLEAQPLTIEIIESNINIQ